MFLKLAKVGACRMYSALLEEAISDLPATPSQNLPDPVLARHLRHCKSCREALQAADLVRALLRDVRQPQPEPRPSFASRVMFQIREREEKVHAEFEFWHPIEVFARRLALASSVLLLVLSSTLYQMRASPGSAIPALETITDRFPDLAPEQPANQDEVLVSLAEKAYE